MSGGLGLIAADQVLISDEVLAHLIPGCFEPRPGVKADELRAHLAGVIAERAELMAVNRGTRLCSRLRMGGRNIVVNLIPATYHVEIAEP